MSPSPGGNDHVSSRRPVSRSQSVAAQPAAKTSRRPSGLNVIATLLWVMPWGGRVRPEPAVLASQTGIRQSGIGGQRSAIGREHEAERLAEVRPRSVRIPRPSSTAQRSTRLVSRPSAEARTAKELAASVWPSDEKARARQASGRPMTSSRRPRLTSQSSATCTPPEARSVPSGEKARARTRSAPPLARNWSEPVPASQTLTRPRPSRPSSHQPRPTRPGPPPRPEVAPSCGPKARRRTEASPIERAWTRAPSAIDRPGCRRPPPAASREPSGANAGVAGPVLGAGAAHGRSPPPRRAPGRGRPAVG